MKCEECKKTAEALEVSGMCPDCHNTALEKAYQYEADQRATHQSQLREAEYGF